MTLVCDLVWSHDMVLSICSFEQKGEKSQGCRVSRRTMNHSELQTSKKAANKTTQGCEVLNYIRDGLMNKAWMEGSELCDKWWRCAHIEIRSFSVAYAFWQVKLILLCLTGVLLSAAQVPWCGRPIHSCSG